ncbi:MAG: N-glycosylase/DNA lyase [Candidatus Diapherotrites archaeon]|jgi:N-glycosylase/DNA lyase|uniref:8-oxoguanine DNA glycosylase/AP lyase n=1 Tax=Candidatus Iainarchaeum sp. TaxID=3101447 RepID=A0A7K4C064_9ARCH|nr:N-glycosylase/DNA lyase [Candidatus Diapherotrites archaeon]
MKNIYSSNPLIKTKIQKALANFKKNWQSEELIFEEMCYCILTPQSSAKQSMKAINKLKEHNLLDKGFAEQKEPFIKNVRFFRTKAKRLVLVQKQFPKNKIKKILIKEGLPNNPHKAREFLVKEVNGYGWKEASHFLRNVGFGEDIAILDRHILKNLKKHKIIKEIPKTINKKNYLEIEEKMRGFCKKNKVGLDELDLIFWSNETGEVLK